MVYRFDPGCKVWVFLFRALHDSVPHGFVYSNRKPTIMKRLLPPALFFIIVFSASGQEAGPGIFGQQADVGKPKLSGSSTYDDRSQTYTLKGAGYNIWFGRDEFQYLYNKLKGDFILTANFEFVGKGTDPHRKVGWMIRPNTNDNSQHVSAVVHGDGLTVLQWRMLPGALMRDPQDEIFTTKKNFQIIQLERKGKRFTMRVAHPGEPLQEVGSHVMDDMPDEVLGGMFICSHNENVLEEARAWNVRIDKTVADDHNPYRAGFIGSRMEILNVADGKRRVIHESDGRFEAPNYLPDGKKLLYNADGSLFTIPVDGGTPEKVNTGFANRNNNDHGISFDGKMLAISHHRDGLPGGGSTIYVLPLQGGTPKQVTEATPSYWHGWAPSGKEVVFVGQRNGKTYDIYKVNINGGQEIKLTSTPEGAHVDGPEYSPDGKYIYFNASYSGTMQLWRMKPDGSAQEQLTFDEYNDWFPHISPDGKWIAFISFPTDILPNDHPSYKRVMLRIMPATGGAPRVIAFLYGGQGTINVPSWSPDSKHIAFVSNTLNVGPPAKKTSN
jgi:TolB protein